MRGAHNGAIAPLQAARPAADNSKVPRPAPPRRARRALVVALSTAVCSGLLGLVAGGSAPAAAAPGAPARPFAGGGVVAFGDAHLYGSPTMTLSSFVTGMAATPDGRGYWLVVADGGIFAYGDAPFAGSLGALQLNGPVTGMAATPDGKGYWLVALDGGVFAFGDAGFYGSMGAVALVAGVTAMAVTPDGKGYWLVGGDGGIFAFGDAGFHGSLGGQTIPASVAAMAVTPDGGGYWLAGNDGSVYPYGDAADHGSSAGAQPVSPVTAIVPTPDGKGYWLLEPDDWSYSFGDPSPSATALSASITAVAAGQVGPDPDNGHGSYCNPYGPCEPWCALFVTWVWAQAGIPVPSYGFTGSIDAWAAANGRLLPATALAAPGDAVLYGTGPQNADTSVHTGVVVQVWPDGAVLTVEGDAGPYPSGEYNVVVNGPFLPTKSLPYNGFAVYAVAQPVP